MLKTHYRKEIIIHGLSSRFTASLIHICGIHYNFEKNDYTGHYNALPKTFFFWLQLRKMYLCHWNNTMVLTTKQAKSVVLETGSY